MSKELEYLKELEMWATNGYTACDVEKAKELVKPIETSLKAIEIIKNQIHSLNIFKGSFYFDGQRISKEEYELLKEVLI